MLLRVITIFKLFRGAEVYGPSKLGRRDVLTCGEKIVAVEEQIDTPRGIKVDTFDVGDKMVFPGYIDLHVHLIGGGGEAGPESRVPSISVEDLARAGITTVVGVLGTDDVTRHPESLLAKSKALDKYVSSFMYTGSYHFPPVNLTGSVKRDIALIDEVVGVKLAISDHRSSQLSLSELARLASEARVGGMIGGKPGLVHLHTGGGTRGLTPIVELTEEFEIPISQFLPTHVGRSTELLEQGIKLIEKGGYIDLTAPSPFLDGKVDLRASVQRIVESGAGLSRVTLSSDGNGSIPEFDAEGNLAGLSQGKVSTIHSSVKSLSQSGELSITKALELVTSNAAKRLGIFDRKGSLEVGKDADLIVLNQDFEIEKVLAKGKFVLPLPRGIYW